MTALLRDYTSEDLGEALEEVAAQGRNPEPVTQRPNESSRNIAR